MLRYNLLNNKNLDLTCLVDDNNLELIKELYNNKLLENIYDRYSISPYTKSIFNIACLKGQIKICYFLHKTCNIKLCSNYFILACSTGQLDIAKWLCNYVDILEIYIYDNHFVDGFYISCINNQYEMLLWLITLDKIKHMINTIRWDYLFLRCCRLGLLKIVQFLYNNNIYDKTNIDISFLLSCHNNNLDVCKWMFELDIIDIHLYNDFIFIGSCYNGAFDVCKWLFENVEFSQKTLNISFSKSCIYNRKNICEWLLSISNIDIHDEYEYAFRLSDLDMQKWLISIDGTINVNMNEDYAFCRACNNNNFEQVKWLLSISNINIYNFLRKKDYYNIYDNQRFIKLIINYGVDIYDVDNLKLKKKLKKELFILCKNIFEKYICNDILYYIFNFLV